MNEIMNSVCSGLAGVVLTVLVNYIATLNIKREKKNRECMRGYLEQLKSFYNLESLYREEVEKLRNKLPDAEWSKTDLGIKKEFRKRNEEDGNKKIVMTAGKAEQLLENLL